MFASVISPCFKNTYREELEGGIRFALDIMVSKRISSN